MENGDNVRPCSGLRPRRFGNSRCTSRHYAAGISQSKIVTTSRIFTQRRKSCTPEPSQPLPPLKSEAAPAQRAGTISLLILDDVTKLLSGVMSRLALQGDGPLREPSPRQQGIFCAVVNH
ncbi:hypothetical protein LM60_20810 [Salmonella enterica]|nr:hypothetical protein [Salmonella enterica]